MPGLSLWLSPPPNSSLNPILTDLISTLSDTVADPPAPHFLPHITITSHIPTTSNPEEVVAFAAKYARDSQLKIQITGLDFGPAYLKKIFLRIEKSNQLTNLAENVRRKYACGQWYSLNDDEAAAQASEWVSSEYDPHLSLVYMDQWPLDHSQIETAEKMVDDAIVERAWYGGRIALYETQGPADQWKMLAFVDV
ncbi:2',3'-cyclic-nucleotide 3'-phosphodiesterase [Kockiozyma suomiensis]|uniref:2',3'-cyclic-nucleotide 3'-phosphodiesterase n=1 Tax=Kockiozyma suomiensis TaxID=1337062 RepID=UPI003343CE70